MKEFEIGKFYRSKDTKLVYLIIDKTSSPTYKWAICVNSNAEPKLPSIMIFHSVICYYEEVTASFEVKKPVCVKLYTLRIGQRFKCSQDSPDIYVVKANNTFGTYTNSDSIMRICAYIDEKKPDELLQANANTTVLVVD